MINDMKSLALNVFFIFVALFFYQIFWLDNPKIKNKNKPIVQTTLLALLVLLCMSFPFSNAPGFFFDLRSIPFIVGAMYGGYRSSIILFLTMNIYRFFTAGNGFYASLVVSSSLLLCMFYFLPRFESMTANKRIQLLVQFSIAYSIITSMMLMIFTSSFTLNDFKFTLVYTTIQALCMWMTAYSIETIRKNAQLRNTTMQIEKLKMVSELAASVSHEVKNPLTAVKGFIQLLQESPNIPEERKSFYLDVSLQELQRAQVIISDYLSFAKHDMSHVESLDLKGEIQYAISAVLPLIHTHKINVMHRLVENSFVLGDRQKVKQCFINLLKNSIESMEAGGELEIFLTSNTDNIEIIIQDTGIGMTEEQISRLGTPYYSTKEKGTGLGTMVAFSIVKTMGGEIKVESHPGRGTKIILSFSSNTP